MFSLIARYKIFVIGAALLLAVGLWYGLSPASAPGTDPLLTSTPAGEGADKGVVEVLLKLRAIKLDATIFSQQSFAGLQDFSTEITLEPVGRPNPFAPLGGEAQPTNSTTKGAGIFTKPSSSSATPAKR